MHRHDQALHDAVLPYVLLGSLVVILGLGILLWWVGFSSKRKRQAAQQRLDRLKFRVRKKKK